MAEHVRAAYDRNEDVSIALSDLAWKSNPRAAFADMNPNVGCEHASMT